MDGVGSAQLANVLFVRVGQQAAQLANRVQLRASAVNHLVQVESIFTCI